MTRDPLPRYDFDPDRLVTRLDLTLAGTPREIGAVVERVMDLVRSIGCAAGKEFEVETALREALANAVLHGCQADPEKQVEVIVGCDDAKRMLIVVRDPGRGFDPATIPSPIVGENVYSSHGRGIFLINQLMDEVRFMRGGTEIHMVKH